MAVNLFHMSRIDTDKIRKQGQNVCSLHVTTAEGTKRRAHQLYMMYICLGPYVIDLIFSLSSTAETVVLNTVGSHTLGNR